MTTTTAATGTMPGERVQRMAAFADDCRSAGVEMTAAALV